MPLRDRLARPDRNTQLATNSQRRVVEPQRRGKPRDPPGYEVFGHDPLAFGQGAGCQKRRRGAGSVRHGLCTVAGHGRHRRRRPRAQNPQPSARGIAGQFNRCPIARARRDVRWMRAVRQIAQRCGHLWRFDPCATHCFPHQMHCHLSGNAFGSKGQGGQNGSHTQSQGQKEWQAKDHQTCSTVSRNRIGRPAKADSGRAGSSGATTVLRSDSLTTSSISVEASASTVKARFVRFTP